MLKLETATAKRLLTIPEAAGYLSASVWSIRTLLWSRQVPYVKLGRRHLIDPHDLERFIEISKLAA